jgi:hypothetical protein
VGYSCKSYVITVCQDIADSLDDGGRIDAINRFFEGFQFSSHDWQLTKIAASGVDSRVVVRIKEFLLGRAQSGRAIFRGCLNNVGSTTKKCTWSTTVTHVCKLYLEKY